ncbi:MAG: GrpB family protein, partial [Acidimicrobiales bacterium]
FSTPLEGAGFVFRRENPERTKRYFREPAGEQRTHIHVRRAGSFSEQFALLFRDYLRHHAERAASYATIKRDLAAEYRDNRQGYVDAKGPFIWETMRLADAWAQATGWEPGPSDA